MRSRFTPLSSRAFLALCLALSLATAAIPALVTAQDTTTVRLDYKFIHKPLGPQADIASE